MARIRGVPQSEAGIGVKLAYFFTRKQFKDLTGRDPAGAIEPVEIYAHAPKLLKAYGKLEQATSKISHLDDRARTLAELKTSTIAECEYCMDLGSAAARAKGVSDDELLALPRHRESELFDDRDRLVIDYAVAMTRSPVEVTDELFAGLREYFDEQQMVELTHVIAIENFRSRCNLAYGIGAKGFSEGMVCTVPASAEPAISPAIASSTY